jgi:hypothetical protein
MIKDFKLYFWLNLPRDDHHFGYTQKFLNKNTGTAQHYSPQSEVHKMATVNQHPPAHNEG